MFCVLRVISPFFPSFFNIIICLIIIIILMQLKGIFYSQIYVSDYILVYEVLELMHF